MDDELTSAPAPMELTFAHAQHRLDLYRKGRFAAGAAVEFIGNMDRYEFLYECRKRCVEPQTYESIEELQSEIDTHLFLFNP